MRWKSVHHGNGQMSILSGACVRRWHQQQQQLPPRPMPTVTQNTYDESLKYFYIFRLANGSRPNEPLTYRSAMRKNEQIRTAYDIYFCLLFHFNRGHSHK